MTAKPTRESNAFTKRSFADPPAHFHPGYFWLINDRIDEAQLIAQLRDLAAHGAMSVCLHPCPPEFRPRIMPTYVDRPYLSKSYFHLLLGAVHRGSLGPPPAGEQSAGGDRDQHACQRHCRSEGPATLAHKLPTRVGLRREAAGV